MNELLKSCVNGGTMNETEAHSIMRDMMTGSLSAAEIGGLLSVLAYRGETAEEIAGFVKAMREQAQTINGPEDVVDTCGTGGDGSSTFNISTAAAIIASSAGAKLPNTVIVPFLQKAGALMFSNILAFQFRRRLKKRFRALNAAIWDSSMRQAITLP